MKTELDFGIIGVRIQQYRMKNKMTQEDLAGQIGSNQKYISRLEAGEHRSSLDTIAAIAKALHVSIDSLIADYDDSNDESNLQEILNDIRGMSAIQLGLLRDLIEAVKKLDC